MFARLDADRRATDARLGAPAGLSWMPGRRWWLLVFAVAATIAWLTLRPDQPILVGSDTVSSVLYGDRIVSGERLEAFVGTTPKPWLSVIDGLLFGLTHDWRAIAVAAVLLYAAAVASASVLVARLGGGAAGAAFSAAGFIASWQLFQDVSLAYGGSWLLLSVSVAGLCLTGTRQRAGLAGLILLVGALARQEVLFVTVLAIAAAAFADARPDGAQTALRSRRVWLLAIGLLAVPLTGLHDWLLTGDPTYSLHVQTLGAAGRSTRGLVATARFIGDHFRAFGPLVAVGAIGVAVAIARRTWIFLLGVTALAPLVVALILFVGWRHLIVLERYLLPVDLAIVAAASLAIGAGADRIGTWTRGAGVGRARLVQAVAVVAAIALGIALNPRIGPLDRAIGDRVSAGRQVITNLELLRPVVERAIAAIPDARVGPAYAHPFNRPTDRTILLVPAGNVALFSLTFDLPLDRMTQLDGGLIAVDGSEMRPGWLVYLEPALTIPPGAFQALAGPAGTHFGSVTVDPIAIAGEARLIHLSAPE